MFYADMDVMYEDLESRETRYSLAGTFHTTEVLYCQTLTRDDVHFYINFWRLLDTFGFPEIEQNNNNLSRVAFQRVHLCL